MWCANTFRKIAAKKEKIVIIYMNRRNSRTRTAL